MPALQRVKRQAGEETKHEAFKKNAGAPFLAERLRISYLPSCPGFTPSCSSSPHPVNCSLYFKEAAPRGGLLMQLNTASHPGDARPGPGPSSPQQSPDKCNVRSPSRAALQAWCLQLRMLGFAALSPKQDLPMYRLAPNSNLKSKPIVDCWGVGTGDNESSYFMRRRYASGVMKKLSDQVEVKWLIECYVNFTSNK